MKVSPLLCAFATAVTISNASPASGSLELHESHIGQDMGPLPIPEPAAAVLGTIGLLCLLTRRR